ncbi:hypothetical protein Q5P01_011775 [Channa striata]|uniref:Uncharacterized protein n=1 Tax=Channa striata TaxID=64152 RepID=A0AA88MUA4_CHASR|nr:hypothetical protein Q5P01_011775 [Channa striata]
MTVPLLWGLPDPQMVTQHVARAADSQAIGSVQLPSSPPLSESTGLSLDTGEPEGVGAECKRIGCPNTPVKGRRAAESNSHEDEPWPQRHDIDTGERKEPFNHKSGIVASGNRRRQ